MRAKTKPSISAVIAAYQAEEWIEEAIDSILGQTRLPDEVIVVDDGSTDGTPAVLAGYGDRVRTLRQENAGYQVAMNRAIREASGEFVALCGADDIWEPRKLQWQAEALAAHPEVGVLFGHAVLFGQVEGEHERPTSTGVLDGGELLEDLVEVNPINMPSAVIRRELFDRLGWFTDGFIADDFEFFFRCLRAGVTFYYEPRTLVRYRRHDQNMTKNNPAVREAMYLVHRQNRDLLAERGIEAEVMAQDLFRIGRAHVDEGNPRRGRAAIRGSLRYAHGNSLYANARAVIWIAILSLPSGGSRRMVRALLGIRGVIHGSSREKRPQLT